MKVLFIITARGGSKGVPRKNITVVGKLPLIAYKIIAARKCQYDCRIIVSTDDIEIAEVGRRYGGEVPFMRPAELASDTAGSMDVVCHAMKWIEENDTNQYDYICLLEPSSPFLSYQDINQAFAMMMEQDADTLLGMKEAEVSCNFIHPLDDSGKLSLFYEAIKDMKGVRRQEQKPEYTLNGCIYAAKWNYFKKNHLFHSINSVPYIMSDVSSIEIDSKLDLLIAKMIAENNLVNLELWD